MAETTFSLTDDNELLEFDMIPTGPRGLKGDPGDPGSPGEPGQPGDDGFSPTVTVQDITGGHRVVITDAQGPHTFDVMDGQGGGGGGAVESVNGKTGVVVLGASDVGALPDTTQIDEVAVQSTEPTSQTNKMWIDPEGEGEVQLALFSDIHSPLSKILDVTLSEEAALIVTEIGGVPLSVEELHLEVIASGDVVAGNARAYCGTQKVGESYHGAQTGLSDRHWFASWKKVGGSWVSECCDTFATNQFATVKRYFVSESDGAFAAVSVLDYPKIDKLMLPKLPADTRIILYAR